VEPTAVRLAVAALKDFDQCSIAQADCYRLPFSPKTFDLAVMADVIEHLEDPESALAEAALVLKPDGILLVTTPKWRADRVWDVHHVREYTPSEIYACLSAFFQSVDISYFWPLFWSRLYSTRIGWRLLRAYSRYFSNPFLKVGAEETLFGQILAVCRGPKSSWQCNAGAVISNNHVT
jgi:SAM-dependent methyltransferase